MRRMVIEGGFVDACSGDGRLWLLGADGAIHEIRPDGPPPAGAGTVHVTREGFPASSRKLDAGFRPSLLTGAVHRGGWLYLATTVGLVRHGVDGDPAGPGGTLVLPGRCLGVEVVGNAVVVAGGEHGGWSSPSGEPGSFRRFAPKAWRIGAIGGAPAASTGKLGIAADGVPAGILRTIEEAVAREAGRVPSAFARMHLGEDAVHAADGDGGLRRLRLDPTGAPPGGWEVLPPCVGHVVELRGPADSVLVDRIDRVTRLRDGAWETLSEEPAMAVRTPAGIPGWSGGAIVVGENRTTLTA